MTKIHLPDLCADFFFLSKPPLAKTNEEFYHPSVGRLTSQTAFAWKISPLCEPVGARVEQNEFLQLLCADAFLNPLQNDLFGKFEEQKLGM